MRLTHTFNAALVSILVGPSPLPFSPLQAPHVGSWGDCYSVEMVDEASFHMLEGFPEYMRSLVTTSSSHRKYFCSSDPEMSVQTDHH